MSDPTPLPPCCEENMRYGRPPCCEPEPDPDPRSGPTPDQIEARQRAMLGCTDWVTRERVIRERER